MDVGKNWHRYRDPTLARVRAYGMEEFRKAGAEQAPQHAAG
jgi:hypothetical protein